MKGDVVDVKIYIKKNQYAVRFRSSRLKGEMTCKNLGELDKKMSKIIKTFPNLSFNIKFSQGALGRYTWELDSPKLLYNLGYKFMGYLRGSETSVYYNDELREFVVIDKDEFLKKYKLN